MRDATPHSPPRPSRRALATAIAAALLAGCSMATVKPATVARLPLEAKLDLIEAENELFIAFDSVDEATTRLLETREQLRRSGRRIEEAKEALDQAKQANDAALVEIADLGITEARQRRRWLRAHEKVVYADLQAEKAQLQLAQARFEQAKATLVKKANVPGSEKIDLEDYAAQVKSFEERVKDKQEDAKQEASEAEAVRTEWNATRRLLADKTGGGQGSPWVQ